MKYLTPRLYGRRGSLPVGMALACALSACPRREGGDERMPLALASADDWNYATHPSLPLGAEDVRTTVLHALELSSRFAPVAQRGPDAAIAGKVSLRFAGADVVPDPAETQPDRVAVQVRVRVELVPPLSDEPVVATVGGQARASLEVASRRALESAASRALDEAAMALSARTKSDEELVAELASADAVRANVALDRLSARRHGAAYEPLMRLLRSPDLEQAQRALSGLVTLHDVRIVRPIIEEAEKRELPFVLEALYALGSIGGEDAEAYLFTVDSGHADPRIRAAAHEALAHARRLQNSGADRAREAKW